MFKLSFTFRLTIPLSISMFHFKFIFADVNSFSITYQAELYQSTQTGISGFHLDGNEFSIFGNCLPKETCNNNQDDDGDNLVDCNDPDCQVAPPAAIIYDQQ